MFLNKMCALSTAAFLAVAASAAFAQQPAGNPPAPNSAIAKLVHPLDQSDMGVVTYVSAADVEALIDRAKKESNGDSRMVTGNILKLPPYTTLLEYRPAGKDVHFPAGTHEKDAELFYVMDGSATLTTGGTLMADHMGIDGGQDRKVGKGDFIFIPEGTPHGFSHVEKTLVLMSIHVPRPIPGK